MGVFLAVIPTFHRSEHFFENSEKFTEASGCFFLCSSRQVCTKKAYEDILPLGFLGSPLPIFDDFLWQSKKDTLKSFTFYKPVWEVKPRPRITPNKTHWSSIPKSHNRKRFCFWKIYWRFVPSLFEVTWTQATWNLKGPSKCAVAVSCEQKCPFQAIQEQVLASVQWRLHSLITASAPVPCLEKEQKSTWVSCLSWLYGSLIFFLPKACISIPCPCSPWVLNCKRYLVFIVIVLVCHIL